MRRSPSRGSTPEAKLAAGNSAPVASPLDPFDPDRFRNKARADIPIDAAFPVDEVIRHRDRITDRFSRVPISVAHLFPPTARVLLLLTHAPAVRRPDLDGGWYRLGTGLATDFHLHNKDVRHRALATLEKAGIVEVRREVGKSPLIRIAPEHRAAFQPVSVTLRPPRGGAKIS